MTEVIAVGCIVALAVVVVALVATAVRDWE